MKFEGVFFPDYTKRGLVRLLPSIASHLGVEGEHDSLGLPSAGRYLVLLVDGLGWHQLRKYAATATYLGSLAANSEPITCGVPATTATSLTSLGTGLACGEHGLVGYRFRNPATGEAMNALSWAGGPENVGAFQPFDTCFQRLNAAGHPTANISLSRFENSGLSLSAMRGARFYGVEDESDHRRRIELAVEATASSQVVYFYERLLDHTGHAHGVGSWQWLDQLGEIDDLAADLRAALDEDVCLIVTGDHGMVNITEDQFIVIENHPELAGYHLLAGEARFRHLYTEDPEALKRRWADFLGDRAWVFTRDEGIAAGLFGKVRPEVYPRLGDVMVAMRDHWVLMTQSHPIEMSLVGVHGSMTAEEMLVPLLIDSERHG